MLKFLRGALCLCAAIVFMESNALARTYFIPDYQRNLVGKRVEGGGKDKNDRNCETYGYMSSCPAKKVGTGKHSIAGLTCYEKCICDKSYYKYNSSNCSGLHILAGESCSDKVLLNTGDKIDIGGNLGELKPFDPGTGALGSVSGTKTSATTGIASPGIAQSGIYYTACVCFPGHTLSVCPEGAFCTQCDGMYKFVNCQEGYTQSGKGSCVKQENCDAYPLTVCPAGGICSKCPDNNAKLKLDSCDASKGWTKSGNNCVAAACPAGYTAGVATCSTGSYSQNGYSGGQICGKCTLSDECPAGYGKTACTSTQKETGRTTTEAGTTCYKCEAKDDTCPSGYQKSACSSTQKQTGSTTTEAGSTCYKCEQTKKQCSSHGYMSYEPSGMLCVPVTYEGLSCYNCVSGGCPSGLYVKDACPSGTVPSSSPTMSLSNGIGCYTCSAQECPVGTDRTCPATYKAILATTLDNGTKCYTCKETVFCTMEASYHVAGSCNLYSSPYLKIIGKIYSADKSEVIATSELFVNPSPGSPSGSARMNFNNRLPVNTMLLIEFDYDKFGPCTINTGTSVTVNERELSLSSATPKYFNLTTSGDNKVKFNLSFY